MLISVEGWRAEERQMVDSHIWEFPLPSFDGSYQSGNVRLQTAFFWRVASRDMRVKKARETLKLLLAITMLSSMYTFLHQTISALHIL